MIVDTFLSPHRLHIHMILNANPLQKYTYSKICTRVYKPATQALAYPMSYDVFFAVGVIDKK